MASELKRRHNLQHERLSDMDALLEAIQLTGSGDIRQFIGQDVSQRIKSRDDGIYGHSELAEVYELDINNRCYVELNR